MSERIITLFGEEIVPEQLKAVGRSRAKKKPAEQKEKEPEVQSETESETPVEAAVVNTALPGEMPLVETQANELATVQATATAPKEETKTEARSKKKAPAQDEATELPEGWKGDKQYYSIGEVAALFNVKTSHIRFWTNEFKIKVRTTRKGDRLYTPEQIKQLKTINHLVKERKFTLSGANAKVQEEKSIDVETIDLKQHLLQLRNKLVAIKNQLK